MAEKTFNTRIQQKIDTEANWSRATFESKRGEIYFYDKDSEHDYVRMKVGDGESTVGELDFFNEEITIAEIDEICVLNTDRVGCYITKVEGSADFTVNWEPYDPDREYTPGDYVDLVLTEEDYIEDFYNISVINNTTGEDIAEAGIHGGRTAVEVFEMPPDGITVNFARPEGADYTATLISSVSGSAIETSLYNRTTGESGPGPSLCYFEEGDDILVTAQYEDIDSEELAVMVDGEYYAEYDAGGTWYFTAPAHDITVEIMYK